MNTLKLIDRLKLKISQNKQGWFYCNCTSSCKVCGKVCLTCRASDHC